MIHARLRAASGRDRIPTDGLIAFYSMDSLSGSTLIDDAGSNDGTISGATQVAGVIGQALNFDGGDHVSLGNPAGFKVTAYSISSWVKTTNATQPKQILSHHTSGSIVWQHRVDAGGQVRQLIANSSNSILFNAATTATVNDGAFHHIVSTVGGGVVRIYIDDVLELDSTYSGTPSTSSSTPLYIGARFETSFIEQMIGDIDQLRFYDRALTAAEVSALYAEGA